MLSVKNYSLAWCTATKIRAKTGMMINFHATRISLLFVILTFFFITKQSDASEMRLGWPVACALGQTCWIVNYVDDDPSKTSGKDYQCGDMTYEGHDGTDIAIKDHKTIEDNVNVLAAADGTVLNVRDAVEDRNGEASALDAARKTHKECGNGVLITHEGGWETIYCHMKKGSISVVPGQHIQTGDRLGAVGQSGLAEFPHLHFGVIHNHKAVDPFTGVAPQGCGIKNTVSLWNIPITYDPLTLYASGFSNDIPVYDRVINDTSSPPHIAVASPALLFWILFYGAEPGDRIILKILDPDGKIYAQIDTLQEKKKIHMMKYIGLRTKDAPLHPGTYTGKATLLRELPDRQILRRTIESTVVVDTKD